MQILPTPGLGELLRYVRELVDRGAEEAYERLGIAYRPRYTPILRAMKAGATTVTDITTCSHVTQGAVSQTVALMVADGLIERVILADGRKSGLHLTASGRELVDRLEPHWEDTFVAIVDLEKETGHPLRRVLADTAGALERTGFADRIHHVRQHRLERDRAIREAAAAAPTNWFDRGGREYAQFRPDYPDRLAMFLAALAPATDLAVDVGCGNGQLAAQLAPHFVSTIGLDPSAEQIANAQVRERIEYLQAPAENLPIPDNSASLITAAQAAHWFDRPTFYAEARRIAVDGAVLALISYGVMRLESGLADRFHRFYHSEIGPYWPAERRLVDTGYADIEFPFEEYPAPSMQITKDWTLQQLLGYISTWSAVRRIDEAVRPEILHAFAADLAALWGDPLTARTVTWPINMRLGIL